MSDSLHRGDFTSQTDTDIPVPRYYGSALVELAGEREEIVALSGDLTPSTECDLFRDAFPDRFFIPGIAEANMVGMAAGMARAGDIPFVHSFAVFLSRRSFDQVALQIAYPRTNVKLIGFLPGLTTPLGVSHQAIEDIALMRALPNMMIIEPAGAQQVGAAVRAIADHNGPVYLRLPRVNVPLDPSVESMDLVPGKAQILRDGDDAVIFACGHMVAQALIAATELSAKGIHISVANVHTLKPLDRNFVAAQATRTGCVITAENHSVIGGLGSAVAETLMEAGIAAKFGRIGIGDVFGEGGSTPYLFDKYGLSARHIEKLAIRLLGGPAAVAADITG